MPVKFYLESRPNKANEHPIRVSVDSNAKFPHENN